MGRARESRLVDPEGYFWHREAPVHQHGDTTAARVEALRLVTESQPVRQALASEGIQLIAWRALRDAQRSGA